MHTHLSVDDDIHEQISAREQSVDGSQAGPEVVGIEHLKLRDGLKFVYVVFRYLVRGKQNR